LQAACVNPVLHYKLEIGLLKEGDPADCILVNNLRDFKVEATYINGQQVSDHQQSLIASVPCEPINQFNTNPCKAEDLAIEATDAIRIPVIEALDGQLITPKVDMEPTIQSGQFVSDPQKDLLKIVVVNRYQQAPIAKAFIKNFGFKHGAIASSVAHDSHNIVSVGVDDISLCKAINLVINEKGGVSCVKNEQETSVVGLPVAGLMSAADGYEVSAAYTRIDAMAKSLGSTLSAPFMTLSFMALLVIPHLKLSDRGLFDGDQFKFIS
jgi:adenine deaminase